jgi:nucleoside permease NupC
VNALHAFTKGSFGLIVVDQITLQLILSYVFYPITFFLGM